MMSEQSKEARTIEGVVVSDKMDKTIVVEVGRTLKHPRYGKYMKRTSKMHAHDEENSGHVGDKVRIQMSKPISKMKTWKLVEIMG